MSQPENDINLYIAKFIRKLQSEKRDKERINYLDERIYDYRMYSQYLQGLLDENNTNYLEIEDWIAERNQNAGEEIK